MTRHLVLLLGALLLTMLPAEAEAAGGGGHARELVWQALNLLLLIGVLVYFGRKPVRTFIAERRHEIERKLDDASKLLSQSERQLADWQQRQARIGAEIEEIRRLARERAEAQRQAILADARASAERIRADAQVAAEQEFSRARAQLRAEAAELATELAAEIISQSVTDSDRGRLVDEFVQRIEQPAPAGRSQ